jgi:hypothetical protein
MSIRHLFLPPLFKSKTTSLLHFPFLPLIQGISVFSFWCGVSNLSASAMVGAGFFLSHGQLRSSVLHLSISPFHHPYREQLVPFTLPSMSCYHINSHIVNSDYHVLQCHPIQYLNKPHFHLPLRELDCAEPGPSSSAFRLLAHSQLLLPVQSMPSLWFQLPLFNAAGILKDDRAYPAQAMIHELWPLNHAVLVASHSLSPEGMERYPPAWPFASPMRILS